MPQFPSTQWSLIRRSGESPSARYAAFGELASAYGGAILAYFSVRLGAQEAEDALQSFLAASYEHAWWSRADAESGSFRGFLLMLMRRHLGRLRTSRLPDAAEDFAAESIVDPAPAADRQFDTRFALVLTTRALDALRAQYLQRGRAPLFERLLPLLGSPPGHGELQAIAATLDMPANTLTVEIKRLRARLREQLRAQLRELCQDQASFDADWSVLQQVLVSDD